MSYFSYLLVRLSGLLRKLKSGSEKNFISRYSYPAKKLAKSQALLGLISTLPRFALEVIAFGIML